MMFAATSPSEPATSPLSRSDGRARVAFKSDGTKTRLDDLYQSDPCRVLFPNPGPDAPAEAVFVTTSGGIAGGDKLVFEISAGAGSAAAVTTQAAEKIYRSLGENAAIDMRIDAGPHSTLEWMPQETILFDRARLRRRTAIDMAEDARVLAGEIIVFGRIAMGETFRTGFLQDSWRVHREGRLIWADTLRIDEELETLRENRFAFDGAVSLATFIYCGKDAADHLEFARETLEPLNAEEMHAGASVIDNVLITRFLGRNPAATRIAISRFWSQFRSRVVGFPARLPRVWET